MKKAAEGLSVSCPKLVHVSRSVYATIRVLNLNIDKLVHYVKKIFVKSPAGMELYKTKLQTHHSPQPH
jgi:hypothetical protein